MGQGVFLGTNPFARSNGVRAGKNQSAGGLIRMAHERFFLGRGDPLAGRPIEDLEIRSRKLSIGRATELLVPTGS